MNPSFRPALIALVSAAAALLSSCAVPPRSDGGRTATPSPAPSGPGSATPSPASPDPAPRPPSAATAPGAPTASLATTAQAYRRDAATHLYAHNATRIYKGMLKPQLYAIGVLEVDIDRNGFVLGISWRRAPRHAPEVIAEIERTVRAAAPFPAPLRLGRVTYTDVWLWDRSGQFQLDTLTEGQM